MDFSKKQIDEMAENAFWTLYYQGWKYDENVVQKDVHKLLKDLLKQMKKYPYSGITTGGLKVTREEDALQVWVCISGQAK